MHQFDKAVGLIVISDKPELKETARPTIPLVMLRCGVPDCQYVELYLARRPV